MASYTTYSAVQTRIRSKDFVAAQQTRCTSLITQVSEDIDGYLGSRYVVPFTSPYPNLVVLACILLTAGDFITGEMIDQPQVEAVERRAESFLARGQALLERLLNNPGILAGSSAVVRDDGEGIAPQMRVSSYPPSIDLQDSSRWRKPVPSISKQVAGLPEEYP